MQHHRVIYTSAILNTGKNHKSIKSLTHPYTTLSSTFHTHQANKNIYENSEIYFFLYKYTTPPKIKILKKVRLYGCNGIHRDPCIFSTPWINCDVKGNNKYLVSISILRSMIILIHILLFIHTKHNNKTVQMYFFIVCNQQ